MLLATRVLAPERRSLQTKPAETILALVLEAVWFPNEKTGGLLKTQAAGKFRNVFNAWSTAEPYGPS
jgi:hypothetical protein